MVEGGQGHLHTYPGIIFFKKNILLNCVSSSNSDFIHLEQQFQRGEEA